MTNHWIDIRNADRIMIIGSNAAENHPISFKWVTKAIEHGAKLISVDPRFTRTSAKAHMYAPMRSGTDIAFINGMIKYVLDDISKNPKNYNLDYIKHYTNASFLVNPKFEMPADLDGVFSGYNAKKRKYDKKKGGWNYQLDRKGIPKKDKSLKDKNCVFQLLKRHMARYDAKTVCNITGTPLEVYQRICQTYAESGQKGKAGTIMYAMGTTQHTYGTQNIRGYAILQLLLGNMGVSGGGINALRGESNVQGSTDHCILFHILPGYLKTPDEKDTSVVAYCKRYYEGKNKDTKSADWWGNARKYIVSLLKAWYGNKATKANGFAFKYLPKREVGKNYSHISLFEAMSDGIIKGMFCMGQNPAVGGPNASKERKALENLDWLVCADLWSTETANFWQRPVANDTAEKVDPSKIKTEVFMLPAAGSVEKEGSVTNSGRWSQWRYAAVQAPGEAKSDLWMLNEIFKAVRARYKQQGGVKPGSILDLNWDYGTADEPDVHTVAKEINGYDLTTGKLAASFGKLKADGTTSSGNWLYCASYTEAGNMAARRSRADATGIGLFLDWSWCWPVNRRIIYNRASVDPQGKPWDPKHPVIAFKGKAVGGKYVSKKWVGDVPDGGWYPLQNPDGSWRKDAKYPFIMKPEGHARIFGMGRADGPFPEHYEPLESPLGANPMGHKQMLNPAIKLWNKDKPEGNPVGTPDKYPIVCTTYRVTEHWQAGAMTRHLPWLAELMPAVFVEMSPELAAEKGIKNGDRVHVVTARGLMGAWACVTKRFRPYTLNGKTVHQVGVPWHWGYQGVSRGCTANVLTPHIGDANTMIPEYKAFLCDVVKSPHGHDRANPDAAKGLGKEVV
jgi:formate dehydrogenase major subunit